MSSADLTVLRAVEEYVIGSTPTSVRAVGYLSFTGNPANSDTVTIDAKVYTFQTTLTNVDGNVKIGATLKDTIANLFNAIGLAGGVPGTDYAAAMTAHPTVDAVDRSATVLMVRAKAGGTAGNALATTESGTATSWGGATLSGGAAGTPLQQIRYTGESINFNIENTQSEELRPDRVETDLVQTSASGGGDINFELSYGTFKEFLASVFCSHWTPTGTNEELRNGIYLRPWTVQKHFQDMSPQQYHNYRGCAFEGMSLQMEIGAIVKGAFTITSFGLDPTTGVVDTQLAGATFPAVSTTTPMNAVTNIQNFTIDGVPYSGCISKLSLQFKNNVRAIQCIGSLAARDMKLGTLEVTGEMEFYFTDGANYEKFVQGTEFNFSFDLTDDAGNTYTFTLPRCKFETGEVVAGGRNSDVMFTSQWRGLYDGTTDRVVHLLANPA